MRSLSIEGNLGLRLQVSGSRHGCPAVLLLSGQKKRMKDYGSVLMEDDINL